MRRARRGRRPTRQQAAHTGDGAGEGRWTISYMDMITVLMCLFVVLFAMSSIDKGKYEELRLALSQGFGGPQAQAVAAAAGVIETPTPTPTEPTEPPPQTPEQLARQEVDHLRELQRRLEDKLAADGYGGWVQFDIDQRGLALKLTGSETYFDADTAVLRPDAQHILSAIAPVLVSIPNDITIEGHTNAIVGGTMTPRDATNWTLSADRATNALLYLVDSGIPGSRISLMGYGAERPVSYDDPSLNRRVEIVVRSPLPEVARLLIPQIAEAVAPPAR